MGFKKNNPGCNCCQTGCAICADDFNRSDNTDISTGSSCGWTEESGTWDITTAALVCTSAGIAVCNKTQPDSRPIMIVKTRIKHSTSGSFCDVIVARTDASNYFYVRFRFGSGLVDIRQCSGGSHSSIISTATTLATSTFYTVQVCAGDDGGMTVRIAGTLVLSTTGGGYISAGDGCGLGCSGSGTATFEDFEFYKGYHFTDSPECSICQSCPYCDFLPQSFQVEFTGITNAPCVDCTTLNNKAFILDFAPSAYGGGYGTCLWRTALSDVCSISDIILYFDSATHFHVVALPDGAINAEGTAPSRNCLAPTGTTPAWTSIRCNNNSGSGTLTVTPV